MSHDNDTRAEAQRRRWMQPNAHLWVRPDAYRFMAPGAPRLLGKSAVGYFAPERCDSFGAAQRRLDSGAARVEYSQLLELKGQLAEIKADLRWRRAVQSFTAKFDPSQPRVPAGSPDGGQWANSSSSTVTAVFADGGVPDFLNINDGAFSLGDLYAQLGPGDSDPSNSVISDENPDPIIPGAHYAQSRTTITTPAEAVTGISTIDDTTARLSKTLASVNGRYELHPPSVRPCFWHRRAYRFCHDVAARRRARCGG